MPRTPEQLADLIAPALSAAGFDLEEFDVAETGERRTLRIVVDRDGGAGLDALAELTRAVSDLLDGAAEPDAGNDAGGPPATVDPFGDAAYDLEVTTPGIERPLTAPRHWRRARGRLVEVTRIGGSAVAGRAGHLDDDQVTLITADKGRIGEVTVPFGDIERAVVQVDFSRPGEAVLRRCGLTDDEIAARRGAAASL